MTDPDETFSIELIDEWVKQAECFPIEGPLETRLFHTEEGDLVAFVDCFGVVHMLAHPDAAAELLRRSKAP